MGELYFSKVIELLNTGDSAALQGLFARLHEADIADILHELPPDKCLEAFRLLDEELASEVLPELNDDVRNNILEHIHEKRLAGILDEMDSDEATDIVSELDDERTRKVLASLDTINREDSDDIRQLLAYDEDVAGGLMQKEIISVQENMKRDEMIEYIRESHEEVENFHYIFVTDEQHKLKGILEVTKLLLAKQNKLAKDLMENDVISVPVNMDQEQVAHMFRKYDIYILPVVDENNVLLGRITVDDIIDVIDEEASEDAYKMVGLESEDRVFSKPLQSARRRTPWLIVNLFTAVLAASVVSLFEGTISRFVILAVFMPIVAGMGGNAGTQTLTVITRGIALGELTFYNTRKALFKELIVGIINGVVLGIIGCAVAYLWKGNMLIGLILGAAMIINMIIAGFFGALIPILMKTLKIDPALASGVIITTLTDVCGFASFLGLATLLL